MSSDDRREHRETATGESTDETVYRDEFPGPTPPDEFIEPQARVAAAGLDHRYLIGEHLGEGGMAVVHLATDVELDRPVAVKRLRTELSNQREARQRFFAEAEIMAELEHPGTTPVFDAGRLPDGSCYYAMKKVSGRTLADILAERGEDDLKDPAGRAHLVGILLRICQTVASAHNQGVIHRDLKPENVMVDDFGAVYVMDWGLAKRLPKDEASGPSSSDRTQAGAVMGTPAYMSPEQASGRAAATDRQSDVFSLGVMLYEILTGTNPFRGETPVESMKGVIYHQPEPPSRRNSSVDRSLSAITMKAIDKDPFRRYRSAVEMAEDLQRHREFRTVSAVTPTRKERLVNWSRRRPRLAAVAATLLGVLLLSTLVAAFEASVENARVALAYGLIDRLEERISTARSEIEETRDRLAAATNSDRLQLEARMRDLEAELEVAQDSRKGLALAITGFTILSPDQRATDIVRESTLDEIATLMELEDYRRARARIEVTLRNAEQENVFGLTEEDLVSLRADLSTAQKKIADDERKLQRE